MPVVIGLLCALGFCGDCSADVRWSDAREGIKAGDGGCFDAPSHFPTGLVEVRVYFGCERKGPEEKFIQEVDKQD